MSSADLVGFFEGENTVLRILGGKAEEDGEAPPVKKREKTQKSH